MRGLAILAFLACVGASDHGDAPELTRPGALEIPGIQANVEDEIDDLDFALDGDRALHLVWIDDKDYYGSSQRQSRELWYCRRDLRTSSWSKPLRIEPETQGTPRILLQGGEIHVYLSDHLRHFESADGGGSWRERPALDSSSQIESGEFDAIPTANSTLVCYVAQRPYRLRRQGHHAADVWVARLSDGQMARPVRVDTLESEYPLHASARMIREGKRLHLFLGWTRLLDRSEREEEERARSSTQGSLLHAVSDDEGATWSAPRRLLQIPDKIQNVDPVFVAGKLVVFVNGSVLYVVSRTDADAWTPASRVAEYTGDEASLGYQTRSVSAAGERAGQVFWIDTRYVRSDFSPSNLPWLLPLLAAGHDPEWSNNDVLSLPLSIFGDGPERYARARPLRWSKHMSYASTLKVRAFNRKTFVVWAGRSKVGRDVVGAHKRPALYFLSLP